MLNPSFILAQSALGQADGTNAPPADAAQTELGASAVAEFFGSGALGLLLEGGFFMWPILLLALVGLAVISERWRSLKMLGIDAGDLKQAVLNDLTESRVDDALERCERERGPVAAILANGLRKYLVLSKLNYDPARLEEKVVKSMEGYGAHILAAL